MSGGPASPAVAGSRWPCTQVPPPQSLTWVPQHAISPQAGRGQHLYHQPGLGPRHLGSSKAPSWCDWSQSHYPAVRITQQWTSDLPPSTAGRWGRGGQRPVAPQFSNGGNFVIRLISSPGAFLAPHMRACSILMNNACICCTWDSSRTGPQVLCLPGPSCAAPNQFPQYAHLWCCTLRGLYPQYFTTLAVYPVPLPMWLQVFP